MPLPVRQWDEVAPLIQPGDPIWYLGNTWWSAAIQITSRSPYSHFGMAGRAKRDIPIKGIHAGDLVLLDVVETIGGRVSLLRDEIDQYPGLYVWAPVNTARYPHFNRGLAEAQMWKFLGTKYGKATLLLESFWHLPFIRIAMYWRLRGMDIEAAFEDVPPYCSMAGSIAYWRGGVDPIPSLPARMTTPGDMSHSLLFAGDAGEDMKVVLVP
jgi:hypothetical protein